MKGKKFTSVDVSHIASIASIPTTKNEEEKLAQGFNRTIEVVDELFRVDVTNIAPTNQVTGLENIYREDEVNTSQRLTLKQALANAPKTHNGFFVVPQILTKDEK